MRAKVPEQSRDFAKSLRTNSTDAERKLWSLLRGGRLSGLKFKRQVPVDGYILDFVCFEHKLIVELDGGQHAGSEGDRLRDAHFRAGGFRTVRFWNNDVLTNIEGVYLRLAAIANGEAS